MALARFISMNGEIVPWDEAKVHVYSPALKYGTGVFEGIRGYWNEAQGQMHVFRLAEHMRRLRYSQTMMRFAEIVDGDEVARQTLELIRANELRETVHIRTTVWVDGHGENSATGPVGHAIIAVPRPPSARVREGCSVQVSAWERIADRAMPMRVKANANYNNSRFAAIQARTDGYDTALFLNARGKVSEGPGMCVFLVRDGVPITPNVTSDILESITRDTVLTLLRDRLGATPVEREIDRSELGAAEEAFFCGTAWEVTPIASVDRMPIGDGAPGPLTRRLQELYFDVVHGRTDDFPDWRTPVY